MIQDKFFRFRSSTSLLPIFYKEPFSSTVYYFSQVYIVLQTNISHNYSYCWNIGGGGDLFTEITKSHNWFYLKSVVLCHPCPCCNYRKLYSWTLEISDNSSDKVEWWLLFSSQTLKRIFFSSTIKRMDLKK